MLGDREFAACLTTLQPELQRRARRLLRNPTDARDLVQATSLRALEKRRLFVRGSGCDLTKWLFRIMLNLHRDGIRAGNHEMTVEWLENVPSVPEAAPAPWTMVDDGAVAAAVQRLPPRLRSVYELFATERCSYATIAARLGMPIKTVGTQIFRARDWLRRELGGPSPVEIDIPGHLRRSAGSSRMRRTSRRRGADRGARQRPRDDAAAHRTSVVGR